MNKKERVDAALRGDVVDRVPVSVWGRDYKREWNAQSLTESLLEAMSRYDWDFLKVQPRSCYLVEDWGARYQPAQEKHSAPVFIESKIRSAADWKRLRPLEIEQGSFGEQLKVMQLLNHGVGFEAYYIQTLSCPLGVAKSMVGEDSTTILKTVREDRSALHAALRVITETLINFAIASMEYGASGIFYTTEDWASPEMLSLDQYREFGEQYDLEFLDAIKSRSKFTVVHNAGSAIYFDLLASYPVHAINWNATLESNPDLREGKLRSGKAVMGGLSEHRALRGTHTQVQEEIAQVLELTGGTHFLLAPCCEIPPVTPSRNLTAVRRALT